MPETVDEYLRRFAPVDKLDRSVLLCEMDAVWDAVGLNNQLPLEKQRGKVGAFYSHPVWVLNGVFSAEDPTSRSHRQAIASQIADLGAESVADYGGGSGALARLIAAASPKAAVDIVEPFPFPYFVSRMVGVPRVRFVDVFAGPYDVVVAQDVLEHVDSPIDTALDIIDATRIGGTVIFANSFWPEIKCHLPATFHLRHQFRYVMKAAGLEEMGRVVGVHHSEVYRKTQPADRAAAFRVNRLAKLTGLPVNAAQRVFSKVRQALVPTN